MKILLPLLLVLLTGCSTFQSMFGIGEVEIEPGVVPTEVERTPRYSENPQMNVPGHRQYRRMNRSRLEEEAELHSQAGSMWVSEGQGSYLFVQNKSRREGDILNVRLEGAAMKQVETKVEVIKKLLKQLEEQQMAAQRLAENENGEKRSPASAEKPKAEEKEDLSSIQSVPAKIVERMSDGNYRVKGAQPFMINQREYKVIVTGLIRPEDFNDEGVNSGKLLDPQFDVVSVRRKIINE